MSDRAGVSRALPLLTLLALTLAAQPSRGASGERELRLSKFNRVYSDLAGELPPIELPPVTVRLTSSHQMVLVKDNLIRMTPLGQGRFSGTVALDLLGKGDLVADVDLGGATQKLSDELLMPPQRIDVAGIVRMARVEGGYKIVTEQLPRTVRVSIRSRLVGRLLDTCAGAALLSFGSLDCDPVAQALENPEVPLPGPGTEFLLADGDLTPADRETLDALLATP